MGGWGGEQGQVLSFWSRSLPEGSKSNFDRDVSLENISIPRLQNFFHPMCLAYLLGLLLETSGVLGTLPFGLVLIPGLKSGSSFFNITLTSS